jgi:hypothetical protein
MPGAQGSVSYGMLTHCARRLSRLMLLSCQPGADSDHAARAVGSGHAAACQAVVCSFVGSDGRQAEECMAWCLPRGNFFTVCIEVCRCA